MVKLYLLTKKKGNVDYVDINIWNFTKVAFLMHLIIMGIAMGIMFLFGIFIS